MFPDQLDSQFLFAQNDWKKSKPGQKKRKKKLYEKAELNLNAEK